jgi:hypothetical protein
MSDDASGLAPAGDEDVVDHGRALAAVQDAFAGLAGSDEVDILPAEGDDGTDIAVAGDAWTLYLSGWPGLAVAFVAIEDEPDDAADVDTVEAAWHSAVGDDVVAAMMVADLDLNGALTAALDASGDPLSGSIAAAVRASAGEG